MKHILVLVLLYVLPLMAEYKVDIVFNNVPFNEECTPEWGFACYLHTPGIDILLDTGSDADILLENMQVLNINPDEIDLIFISHMHYDHTGGLDSILRVNKEVKLFLPASAPDTVVNNLKTRGIDVMLVKEPLKIADNLYSTGELGTKNLKEQSLIIDSDDGLTIITGCAHPGIVRIVEQAKSMHDKKVFLVLGGFHMVRMDVTDISAVLTRLEELGVEHIGPSHCTGDEAIQAFRNSWGEHFINLGCGASFEFH